MAIPEKTGCESVCKQKFLLWFDSRGGTGNCKIYGKRKIMWADELRFGAFIEIWPVILMINTAELTSFAEPELILLVFLSPKQCWLLWNPQLLSVNQCFQSHELWEGLPAVIWKGFLCRNSDMMMHFECSFKTSENRPCQEPTKSCPSLCPSLCLLFSALLWGRCAGFQLL